MTTFVVIALVTGVGNEVRTDDCLSQVETDQAATTRQDDTAAIVPGLNFSRSSLVGS